jgi:hypothetical protein
MTRPREQLHPHIQEAVNSASCNGFCRTSARPPRYCSSATHGCCSSRRGHHRQCGSIAWSSLSQTAHRLPRACSRLRPARLCRHDPADVRRGAPVARGTLCTRPVPANLPPEETAPDIVFPVAVERWAIERRLRRGDRPVIGRYDAITISRGRTTARSCGRRTRRRLKSISESWAVCEPL